jgi:hypothetical protein
MAMLALPLFACGGDDDSPVPLDGDAGPVTAAIVAEGFDSPVGLASIPGDPRLFVVEQSGTVRVVKDGTALATPFLDVSAQVSCCGEGGLLNLAFHPAVAQNRRFFIYTTDKGGDILIAEGLVDPQNPDRATGPVTQVIKIPHPTHGNHNGGFLAFGPDNYLYAGIGDGGGGGDPFDAGQNLGDLRGKIIRLDVDGTAPYEVPPDNPFSTTAGAKPEIWSYGLRNPWRACFDRKTGDLWIGDVGQNAYEEVDFQPAGVGGQNWGWSDVEGKHCYENAPSCVLSAYDGPIHEYSHEGSGASVTGGCVYRGSALPRLAGRYFYAEEVDGYVESFLPDGPTAIRDLTRHSGLGGITVSTFGYDGAGELLFTDYQGGRVHRLASE